MSGMLVTTRTWATLLLLGGGCGFQVTSGTAPPTDGRSDGGPGDGPDAPVVDAPVGTTCFGDLASNGFRVCLVQVPGSPRSLGPQLIDTSTCSAGVVVASGTAGETLCVLTGTSLAVTADIRGEGSRPLVLLATTGDLTVAAGRVLDVSSRAGGVPGAGANPPACVGGAPGGSAGAGGGGGGGGSFGTSGGAGGGGGGGGGGAPTSPAVATDVRGGCRGTNGGAGSGAGGVAGAGGGAIYLIAAGNLTIGGDVNASGAGGLASLVSSKDGGGGGGSGGLIALHAGGAITLNGGLFANGGGGAGGGDPQNTGGDGGDSPDPATPGAPGAAGGSGGSGGAGATDTDSGGGGAGSSRGGGGGGGGVGVIKQVSAGSIGGSPTFSPPLS